MGVATILCFVVSPSATTTIGGCRTSVGDEDETRSATPMQPTKSRGFLAARAEHEGM
jgi:hypothetical protein